MFLEVWALWTTAVAAQEGQGRQVVVSSNAHYPILIDEVEVASFPATTKPGSKVCVLTTLSYVSEEERLVFQGWSHGPKEKCVTLSEPGVYNIQYTLEVLLQVRSLVKEYRTSFWVPRGTRTQFSVAPVVEERPGVRYSFEEWTGGESRFSTENTIAPVRPITLEVKWRKEYLLELEGPEGIRLVGSGWHPEGSAVVLKAPSIIPSAGQDERYQFVWWEGVSSPAVDISGAGQPILTIRMDDTHKIRGHYKKSYLVDVRSPLGVIKTEWVLEGAQLVIEAPPSIEVAADKERITFKGWEGAGLGSAARQTLVVNHPLAITALYDTEYYVKVVSPYGATGEGWYTKGKTAVVTAPGNPSSLFFLKKVFAGYSGDAAGPDPVLRVTVTEPTTVIASYRSQVEVVTLSITIGVLLMVGLIYLLTLGLQKRFKEGWRPFG
jgi:hypothetical protein